MSQQVTPYLPDTPIYTEYPIVHLVRHGRIPNYQTDQPLTEQGRQEALAAGRELANHIQSGETISFHSSPTRRTRQTAELLRDGLIEALAQKKLTATIIPIITVDDRLQNFQFILGELSYDPIQPLFEVARSRLQQNPSSLYESCVTFHTKFWSSPDMMAYWLTHPSEAVEAPESVAERIQRYIAKHLADANQNSQRIICVAHSANLRAFLQSIFGSDPGEPDFCGMATIRGGQVYYQGQVGDFRQPT